MTSFWYTEGEDTSTSIIGSNNIGLEFYTISSIISAAAYYTTISLVLFKENLPSVTFTFTPVIG